jgi:hypothetical protein
MTGHIPPAIRAEVDQAVAEMLDKGYVQRITMPDGKPGLQVIVPPEEWDCWDDEAEEDNAMTDHSCAVCGGDAGPLSVRFGVPGALTGHSLDDARAYDASMMEHPEGQWYIRALLYIPLTGGHEMLYCVWVQVAGDVGRKLHETWDDDETYAGLRFIGTLANPLPGYGLFGAEVVAAVGDPENLPRIESSADPVLGRIMTEPQPYETAVPAM